MQLNETTLTVSMSEEWPACEGKSSCRQICQRVVFFSRIVTRLLKETRRMQLKYKLLYTTRQEFLWLIDDTKYQNCVKRRRVSYGQGHILHQQVFFEPMTRQRQKYLGQNELCGNCWIDDRSFKPPLAYCDRVYQDAFMLETRTIRLLTNLATRKCKYDMPDHKNFPWFV